MTASVKAYKGLGMEGPIAKWYASTTGRDMTEFTKLARRVAAEIPAGANVLDIAPGPGFFSIELAKLGDYKVTGLDISRTFVEIARRNAAEAKVNVEFRQGNAAQMPFGRESFDFLGCRAAFKNFSDPVRAIQEMSRVLKQGGQGWILDLRPDTSPEVIDRHVRQMGLKPISSMFTKLSLRALRMRANSKEQFQSYLSQARFASVEIREEELGFEVRMRK